jgi:hypothetical protein
MVASAFIGVSVEGIRLDIFGEVAIFVDASMYFSNWDNVGKSLGLLAPEEFI